MRRIGGVAALVLSVALMTGMPAATAASGSYVATQAPGLSADGSGLHLSAVDCSSAGNCVAVGSDSGSGAIDVETDGVWAAVPLAARTGAPTTNLVAVSCPQAGACVAVGTAGQQGVIETQKGNAWNATLATGPSGLLSSSYQGSLTSVSCPEAGSCAAVGQMIVNNTHTGLEDSEGLIADLIPNNAPATGSVWSVQRAPEYYNDAPEGASLAGVSCSAPGECRAVGYALDDSTSHNQYALVDDEKNYAWAYGAAAQPADTGGGSAGLVSISCVGDTFVCMAAGYYPRQNHGAEPMIQTIDSVDHAQVTAGLLPIEDTNASLLATSCAPDGTCESVGVAYDSPGDATYGYGWDGYIVSHTYGAQAGLGSVIASNTRSPGDANTIQHNETLTGASCVSGGVCIAVGDYLDGDNHEAGVIDTRTYDSNGTITGETDIRAPEPGNDPSTDDQAPLTGASCNDATHCVLVGAYLNDSNPHGVIETLGAASAPPPTVSKVSPAQGKTAGGTKVTITGTRLSGVTSVTFGTKAGKAVHVVSATKLTVTAPAHGAGVVDVRVTGGGATSDTTSADHFTYDAKPVISNVSPGKGSKHGSTRVTITGKALTGATKVTFGGKAGTRLTVINAGKVVVTAPAHAAGEVDVRVITPGGTSATSKKDAYRFT